jgi:hypothetical protein
MLAWITRASGETKPQTTVKRRLALAAAGWAATAAPAVAGPGAAVVAQAAAGLDLLNPQWIAKPLPHLRSRLTRPVRPQTDPRL